MAESAELNILIETGADFVLVKKIKDNNGDPVDLTGARIASHLREFAEASKYFEFSCMHNGTGGRITVTMPHEMTSQIQFAKGVYDVRVTLADGFTTYTLHGDVMVREGVTKSFDGSLLFMLGIGEYDDLPEVGNADRLYFCYEDRKIYRWNGQNYVATAVGNGIKRVVFLRTADDGITDTYRFWFDDGTYYDYQIINGGITSIEYRGQTGRDVDGVVDHYRVHYIRGHQTDHFDYTIKNGHITYATVNLDLETGDLIMYTPDEYSGPTFRLDDVSGDLIMVLE